MVEHLLAKEDVASSNLVTRSSFRYALAERRLERVRRSLGEGGPPLIKATAGKPDCVAYVLRVSPRFG